MHAREKLNWYWVATSLADPVEEFSMKEYFGAVEMFLALCLSSCLLWAEISRDFIDFSRAPDLRGQLRLYCQFSHCTIAVPDHISYFNPQFTLPWNLRIITAWKWPHDLKQAIKLPHCWHGVKLCGKFLNRIGYWFKISEITLQNRTDSMCDHRGLDLFVFSSTTFWKCYIM